MYLLLFILIFKLYLLKKKIIMRTQIIIILESVFNKKITYSY